LFLKKGVRNLCDETRSTRDGTAKGKEKTIGESGPERIGTRNANPRGDMVRPMTRGWNREARGTIGVMSRNADSAAHMKENGNIIVERGRTSGPIENEGIRRVIVGRIRGGTQRSPLIREEFTKKRTAAMNDARGENEITRKGRVTGKLETIGGRSLIGKIHEGTDASLRANAAATPT